jgi:uncharacterized membrane protein SirB2
MSRKNWTELGPSLLVGVGIILSTLLAVLAAESRWMVLTAPLLLALTVVGADALNSRLKAESSGPSWAALLLGGAFLVAGLIVALRDPGLVKTLIPVIGAGAWVPILPRRKPCTGI